MEHKTIEPRDLLHRLWDAQVEYNDRIRQGEQPHNFEYWMKQYLLGLVSEINEVLDEMNWKRHRRANKTVDKINLGRELADLTKYVLCMWEQSGFTADEMLEYCWDKTLELKEQYKQDFIYHTHKGVPVIITDIDGTIGDWRMAFRDWLVSQGIPVASDLAKSLSIEVDLGMPYEQYLPLKEKFESTGGYTQLSAYPDALDFLQREFTNGVDIIAYTSRPAKQYSRIWSDTWAWLGINNLAECICELRIGSDERIAHACRLQREGSRVLLLEDDPSLALRAANAGVPVVMRSQPYNAGMAHANIIRVKTFTENDSLVGYLKEVKNG
jgi:NTP pyrophosphatase (non-canonical NTP hydrolase)